jgi:predicted nuclease of predicted toxin-antitoxin system
MKLLIDECIDERLRLSFPEHECSTARFSGLSGLKNGQLLDAAEAAGFDVLITVDRSIPNQQNLGGRRVSILILCAATSRLRDLLLLVPAAKDALSSIAPGAVTTIRSPKSCDA